MIRRGSAKGMVPAVLRFDLRHTGRLPWGGSSRGVAGVSVDFLKSLKRFWGGVCAEIRKGWAEKMVKPLFWVEST